MKKRAKKQKSNLIKLSEQEVRQVEGGVYDSGDGGCIPNPFDKYLPNFN
jgi:hypothetical protein